MNFNELLEVAEELEIGVITIDSDYNVVSSNNVAKPLLRRFPDQVSHDCPYDFFSKAVCRNCIFGESSYCRLSKDGRHRHIFFKPNYLSNYNDDLLKESERLKRVLLDNLNSSFLIIDRKGNVERSHFVGDLSILLGKRGFASSLEKIFNEDISGKILLKIGKMESGRNRDMSHFRFELNSQLLWLDIYVVSIDKDIYFLNIDDKTGEHYLLERLDMLSEIEISCLKVDEIGDKVGNLVSGILGYTEMALKKNEDPVVNEILDSIRKISSDSINLLKMMKGYTGNQISPASEISGNLPVSEERKVVKNILVDVEKAIENLENNRELYSTVISDFLHDYVDVSERLPRLYSEEPEEAHRLVHSIKGVAGIIGAYTLQSEANVLEGYLRKEEWEDAEQIMPRFLETLGQVLEELRTLDASEKHEGAPWQTELYGLTLDEHQKELLKENLPLAEAGDYNNLMSNLNQYSSFEWGEDWGKAVDSIREYVKTIDFDGARKVIRTLVL